MEILPAGLAVELFVRFYIPIPRAVIAVVLGIACEFSYESGNNRSNASPFGSKLLA